MGIGISSFTEVVGAGPSRDFDILGIKMFDSAEIRIHPTGKAMARFGTKSQGQGHETTYAQIIAEELGLPANDVEIEEGNTDTPVRLGTLKPVNADRVRWRHGGAKDQGEGEEDRVVPARGGEDDPRNVDRFQKGVRTGEDDSGHAFAACMNHPPHGSRARGRRLL
jgi:hypothetical protein